MSWTFLSWHVACPGLPPRMPSPVQSLCSAGSQSDSTSSATPIGNSFPLCWLSALVHVIDVSPSLCSGTHPLFREWVLHKSLSNDEFEDNYETNLCESRIRVNWKWIWQHLGWQGVRKQALTLSEGVWIGTVHVEEWEMRMPLDPSKIPLLRIDPIQCEVTNVLT